jgi:tetratricopeptide (TPR) repeat protein
MRRFVTCLCSLLVLSLAPAALAEHPASASDGRKATLLDGLGRVSHPVSTRNEEAQKFFDQGLALIFAFNHNEAILSFKRAAELDPNLAMAHWGVALALGPNYNVDSDSEAGKAAHDAMKMAKKLADEAPEHEQAYIRALSKRYSSDPQADKKKLAVAYKEAMDELAKRYPDDLDAAALYAESMMNLRPWELWNRDATPAENTLEIIQVLEGVLKRNPEHTGANHYYIHAVEASPNPEKGLPSAHRLGGLAPQAGHLVHMPAHIFIRVGDYDRAVQVNVRAADVDKEYIDKFKIGGVYAMMYYSHNIHFQAVGNAIQGRFDDAKKAAERLAAHVSPHVKDMPMLEGFLPTPTFVLLRFHRWDDILKLSAPDPKLPVASAIHHFARGMAFAATGKAEEAQKEREEFRRLRDAIPADAMYGMRNKVREVLAVPDGILDGNIAWGAKDAKAIASLQAAAEAEDKLNYMEPKDWWIPARETLGRVLLATGNAAEAEKVFRADLERNPRSGRSLLGLRESLKAQGKDFAAKLVDQEFQAAWKNADGKPLTLDDL